MGAGTGVLQGGLLGVESRSAAGWVAWGVDEDPSLWHAWIASCEARRLKQKQQASTALSSCLPPSAVARVLSCF